MPQHLAVAALALLGLSAAGCKETGTIRVRSLAFTGVKAVDESELRSALATHASSKLPWGTKRYFSRAQFDDDLKRIQAFYADRGYPDARVSGFDAKLNDLQDAVDVTVMIVEGDPVRLVALDFTGFEVIPPAHLNDLKKRIPLKIGRPRDRQLVVTTHEMALNELRDHGYPYAKVDTSEEALPGGKDVKLVFAAQPENMAYFGPVEIRGNETVSARIIGREVTFKAGDLYRRSLIQQTQRRLYGMELFQFVNIESLNAVAQPVEVPTRITVAEGAHQRVNFSAGYGTEEKLRGEVQYHHADFLGDARLATAHVRWSSLDRGIQLGLTQPYFLHSRFSLGGQAQRWYTFTPAYNSTTTGGKVTLTYQAQEPTSWSVSVASERTSSVVDSSVLADASVRNSLIALGLDPSTGEQNGTLNTLGFDLRRSTADDALNARRGYQVTFHVEEAGRLLPGTFAYWMASADGRHYLPISDKITVANRLQLGNIAPTNNVDANVPFSRKFFLGGASSIRGWGRYEVSPLASGLPVGGTSLLAFSSEVRMPVRGSLGVVWFLDGGNVWAESWGVRLNDLLYSVGSGLRYQTRVGPVRFDFGYQLNRLPDLLVDGQAESRHWRMHFSIGQAF